MSYYVGIAEDSPVLVVARSYESHSDFTEVFFGVANPSRFAQGTLVQNWDWRRFAREYALEHAPSLEEAQSLVAMLSA